MTKVRGTMAIWFPPYHLWKSLTRTRMPSTASRHDLRSERTLEIERSNRINCFYIENDPAMREKEDRSHSPSIQPPDLCIPKSTCNYRFSAFGLGIYAAILRA